MPRTKAEVLTLGDTWEKFKLNYLRADHPLDKLKGVDPGKYYGEVWDLCLAMEDRDPQIYSLKEGRMNAVIELDVNVIPASEDAKDKEIAEAVKEWIVDQEDFPKWTRELLDAMAWGFRATQILWHKSNDGVIYPELHGHPQNWFNFDNKGTLRLRTESDPIFGIPIEGKELEQYWLLHRYGATGNNPWGRGFLVNCFWVYFFKKQSLLWWIENNQHTARARLLLLGQWGNKEELQRKLNEFYEGAQGAMVVHTTTAAETALHQLGGASGDATHTFSAIINECDEWIAKIIRGQTLTTEAGVKGSGSYALSKTHKQTEHAYLGYDCKLLTSGPYEKLSKRFVEFNYGEGYQAPKIKFEYEVPEDEKYSLEKLEIAQNMGYPVTTGMTAEAGGWATPVNPDEVLEKPAPTFGGFGEKSSEEDKKKTKQFSLEYATKDKFVNIYDSVPDEILYAYDLYAEELTAIVDGYSLKDNPLTKKEVRQLSKDLIISAGAMAIMAGAFTEYMQSYYFQGQYTGWMSFGGKSVGAISASPWGEVWGKFGDRVPVLSEQFYAPGTWNAINQKYFTVSNVQSTRVIGEVQGFLQQALNEGQTGKWFANNLNAMFDKRGLTRLNPWHIQTVYETNSSIAYNAGIWSMANDPTVWVDTPMLMRTAVGDPATRLTHADPRVNGLVAIANDPIWNSYTPPFLDGIIEFRCRCGVDIAPSDATATVMRPAITSIVTENPFEQFLAGV